jgi:hypothetical protein
MKDVSEGVRQVQERIRNVLGTLNRYRAQHLENARIEWIMTQLEQISELLGTDRWLTHQELRELDFHQVEGTPLEGNVPLERELQAIRNLVENKL